MPRSMSDERRSRQSIAVTYVSLTPSRLSTLWLAYQPHPPAVRAPSQTAGTHPTRLLHTPLAQAVAQTIRLDSERLADRLVGERPITVAVQNPPFGLAEHAAPGAALGVGVSLEAAHCVGQHRDHQALDS